MGEAQQHFHPVYSLVKAEPVLYSRYFATYRKNVWFRPSWKHVQQMMADADECYWIMSGGIRIAGISISENTLGSLFVIPPFGFSQPIAAYLKKYILENIAGITRIHAHNVLPEHMAAFAAEGFKPEQARKCMIRPAVDTHSPLLVDQFRCEQPEPGELVQITRLMMDAYRNSIDDRDGEAFTQDILYYFENNSIDILLDASSTIVDQQSNEIVGVCFVSLWEDLPLIYEIAVAHAYRGKGLAEYMLRKAIRKLDRYYDVLRLFVTTGNRAELLYTKLGFLPGDELTSMIYTNE
ncbi:N-acetyltransferase [Paenibacillus sp. FSL W8-0187]|uniref:GNAT family N-acetyltransferase n=1 Tax=Paenibacillus sp. FSL W8-0187 TaxID=2921710 RepID=UPI0030DB1090